MRAARFVTLPGAEITFTICPDELDLSHIQTEDETQITNLARPVAWDIREFF